MALTIYRAYTNDYLASVKLETLFSTSDISRRHHNLINDIW